MVAKMISGRNVKGALNYNESKVAEGTAVCIGSNLFLKEVQSLSFHEKLSMFTDLNERNTRTKTNTIHISLNFDPSEKLDKTTLNLIASAYMERIGFGDQPYLVYEHHDSAHPHVHIVSTLIQLNGKRIPIHFLGKNASEKARKEIENDFALVPAQGKKQAHDQHLKPIELHRAVYGKSETKSSISQVVSTIVRNYKYTTLAELNAVLRLYNVNANRGGERSQMFIKGGLQFTLTDKTGKLVGTPIKASALSGKPTLKNLEKHFKVNALVRQAFKDPLKRIIDAALQVPTVKTVHDFTRALHTQSILVIYRINPQGRTYGITFVDQTHKTVFNGSDIGKNYSAGVILEKLAAKENSIISASGNRLQSVQPKVSPAQSPRSLDDLHDNKLNMGLDLIIERLSYVRGNDDHSSPENALRLKRRKRKKRRPS